MRKRTAIVAHSVRALNGKGVHLRPSIGSAGPQLIGREYDVPSKVVNGANVTDQHAMREGELPTLDEHLRNLKSLYPG